MGVVSLLAVCNIAFESYRMGTISGLLVCIAILNRRHLSASFHQRGAGAAAQRLRAEAASTASSSAAGFPARELADGAEVEPGA